MNHSNVVALNRQVTRGMMLALALAFMAMPNAFAAAVGAALPWEAPLAQRRAISDRPRCAVGVVDRPDGGWRDARVRRRVVGVRASVKCRGLGDRVPGLRRGVHERSVRRWWCARFLSATAGRSRNRANALERVC